MPWMSAVRHLCTLQRPKGRRGVELLLASKADANAWDKNGWTPLHFAASNDHKEVAEMLLARKSAE
jgi:ankyrin repeat protein